jgi:hypothetical protein
MDCEFILGHRFGVACDLPCAFCAGVCRTRLGGDDDQGASVTIARASAAAASRLRRGAALNR